MEERGVDTVSEEMPQLTDPNSNRLLEKVMDKLDGALFRQGFEFREDKDWSNAVGEIEKFIFKYYDDLTGGDSEYDPNKKSTSEEVEVVEEDEEDEEDAEAEITLGSDTSSSDSPKKKRERE